MDDGWYHQSSDGIMIARDFPNLYHQIFNKDLNCIPFFLLSTSNFTLACRFSLGTYVCRYVDICWLYYGQVCSFCRDRSNIDPTWGIKYHLSRFLSSAVSRSQRPHPPSPLVLSQRKRDRRQLLRFQFQGGDAWVGFCGWGGFLME